ncbi:hypothetical protein K1X76_10175 [bacterium]|nr:hypothetical protein [bacterium]
MKNMKKMYLALLLMFWAPLTWANPYPSTYYSSERIPDSLRGIETGKLLSTSTAKTDIALLGLRTVYVYAVHDKSINKYLIYNGNKFDEFMHLSVLDIDNDGDDDIVVAGFENGVLTSKVLMVEGDKLVVKGEYGHYAARIKWMGQDVLVGQKRLGNDDFTGPLYKLKWDGKKLVEEGEVLGQSGISGDAESLFRVEGFNLNNQPQLLSIKPSGRLVLSNNQSGKWKQGWSSGEEYGGSVLFYNFELKNPLGMTTDNRFFIPVRFKTILPGEEITQLSPPAYVPPPPADPAVPADINLSAPLPPAPVKAISSYNSPQIYVMKNEGYLKNVIGAVPSIKNTQMVRLGYTGYGFQEAWNSPRLDGAITDFTLADWDGDGKEDIIATFLLRDKGYTDTLKRQDSLVIVLKPDK